MTFCIQSKLLYKKLQVYKANGSINRARSLLILNSHLMSSKVHLTLKMSYSFSHKNLTERKFKFNYIALSNLMCLPGQIVIPYQTES